MMDMNKCPYTVIHTGAFNRLSFSAPGVIGFDGALISRCSLDDDIQLYGLSSGVIAVITLLTN